MRSIDATIRRLADQQSGVVTRGQLITAGASSAAVTRARRSGRLVALYPGVYAAGHLALPHEGPWRAAVWSCAAGRTWLSHHDAATLLGLWPGDGPTGVHVTTTGGARSAPRRVVHRVTHIDPRDVTVCNGISTTARLRTLVDLSRVLPYSRFRGLVDAQRVMDLDGLDAAAFRAGGSGAVNRLLADERSHTRSAFERRFRRWCPLNAIRPPDATNVRLGPDEVDVLYRAERVVIELDGRAYHQRRAQMSADRKRDQRLQLRNLRVVRLVWEDLGAEFSAATALTLRRFGLAVRGGG